MEAATESRAFAGDSGRRVGVAPLTRRRRASAWMHERPGQTEKRGGAAAADNDEFGVVPGFVEADGEGPRGWPSSSRTLTECQPNSAMLARTIFSGSSLATRWGLPICFFRPALLRQLRVELSGGWDAGRVEPFAGMWRFYAAAKGRGRLIPVCGPAADLTDMTQQVGGIFIDRVRQVLEPGAAGCRMGITRI
jgi:hypothetical protein